MRILMINSVCGIRSTGRICTDLAEALEKEGHEIKIAYGRESVPEEFRKYAVRIGSNMDVRFHGLKARLFDASGFGSKRTTKRFIKWVKAYDPDVIHMHNIHGYYINIEGLFNYLRTCGKKIIWTLHDCWAFTGHSAYCDAVECELWKEGCHDCPLIAYYPKSYMDKSKFNWERKKTFMSDIPNMTIATPSNWLANLTRDSYLRKYSIAVIHNGVDTSIFYPRESKFKEQYGIQNKIMLLGAATSWNEMKGYSDYVKLSKILENKYKLVMVGLSENQLRQLQSQIIGISRTNSVDELADIYCAADYYINLSYCENYPTTNLEAIACGTPVISYDTGGSPESAEITQGLVVNKGDVEAIVEGLESIQALPNHIDREKVVALVDKETTVKKYMELYS